MKSECVWSERLPGKDGFASIVFDVCFRPDGAQLLVAVGSRVLVFDSDSGDLLHSLKGHRDYVYAVAYSRDGKRFASGGADKTIIIWTSKCEGILKYSHNDSIQCLAYNPTTQQLASATASDFGLWSPEQKSVQKFKVSAKVVCCAWSNDGQFLALGQVNGHVSVRDKQGNEKVRVERREAIWTLSFAPATAEKGADLLAVGCWDQTLSFYDLNGQQMNKDRQLGYDPCSLCYYGDGEYLLIAGSNRKVSLYTKDGVFLRQVTEKEDWVWTVKARPKAKQLLIGCNDGLVALFSTVFSTVHGLYQERYAHRDTMTDVIIQHLISEQKVRIKTRDYVKKIAVYKARLAIQLPDRVLIYETAVDDPYDMHYKLREKIVKQLDCNLLVVTSAHIILCQERKLQLFNFKGKKVREWVLEAIIRYIRVVGGPTGKEGLLIGLKNGCVYKIFIDNRFPVRLVQHSAPIRCLDLSSSRHRLAVVDESSKVFVYDLSTQQVLFEERNANSVAWNTEMEDMLCYSGNGQLSIKTGDFPLHTQALQGFVVGFKGSKIFCLHYLNMQTIDVPQSASLYRYLELRDFPRAYQVACLGVTDTDWRELAVAALQQLHFSIARQAFIRIRDVRYIELLNKLQINRRNPALQHLHDEAMFTADILAFQGHFAEAAKAYSRVGQKRRAIEMFLDLRDWARAKEIIEQMALDSTEGEGEDGYTLLDLLKRQAQWLLDTGDNRGAAELFWAAKEQLTAVNILGQFGLLELLAAKMRDMGGVQERRMLQQAAQFFRKAGKVEWLKEALVRLEEYQALLLILIEQGQWDEAKLLIEQQPQHAPTFWLPYADHLASIDRYEEAQRAYKMAGQPLRSMRMMRTLISNAVLEQRYSDAGYYHLLMTHELLKSMQEEGVRLEEQGRREEWVAKWRDSWRLSEVYFAYDLIHRYTEEPFTSLHPDALFHSSQFLLHHTHNDCPAGVSRVYALYALAKQARLLGAWKLTRSLYSTLLTLRMQPAWRADVEAEAMRVRVRPFVDKEELLAVCYRCSASNPLMASSGDCCINCAHPFVRSFCSFEALPLVRFQLEDGLSAEDAARLITTDWDTARAADRVHNSQGNVQSLSFGQDADDDEQRSASAHDPLSFHEQLLHYQPGEDGKYGPLVASADTLKRMRPSEVFVRRWGGCLGNEYYYVVMPDVAVVMCAECLQFFHSEDWEFHVLHKRSCPFCRAPVNVEQTTEQVEGGVDKTALYAR